MTELRSGAEQFRAARPHVSLSTWPRGQIRRFVVNGANNAIGGFIQGDYRRAYAGVRSFIKGLLGMGFVKLFMLGIYGKKGREGAYDYFGTMLYTPTGPGPTAVQGIFMDLAASVHKAREGDIEGAAQILGRRVDYFLPPLREIALMYESINDREGVRASKMLIDLITKGEIGEYQGKHKERNAYWKWVHIILGTDQPEPKKGKSGGFMPAN